MPTDISFRDTTPTALRVTPEPLGITYLWFSDTTADGYRPTDINLPAEGIDAAPTGHVGGRYPDVAFPDPVDWSALRVPTLVGNYTNRCPTGDLALYWFSGNEWVLAPLGVYLSGTWHPAPLKLHRNGEWLDVATANT